MKSYSRTASSSLSPGCSAVRCYKSGVITADNCAQQSQIVPAHDMRAARRLFFPGNKRGQFFTCYPKHIEVLRKGYQIWDHSRKM